VSTLESIRRALSFIGYSKPNVATPKTTQIKNDHFLLVTQEDNRDVPQFEMERDYFFQEREQELPEEYPFQDFNYGP
tara:strand:- start:1473 stop:1703 length:231 start_codon:yes stop_codon:yes gene_type:complete